jgi:hypothetical protein
MTSQTTKKPETRSLVQSGDVPEVLVRLKDQPMLERLLRRVSSQELVLPGRFQLQAGTECIAVLVHPDGARRLRMRGVVAAVNADPRIGLTLHLPVVDDTLKERVNAFVTAGRMEKSPIERISKLPGAEQRRLARSGTLEERIIVERLLGKVVWEELMRNPNITPPEVGRIAARRDLPTPLISLIVEGEKWIRVPEIRRALLANPRLSGGAIVKVLRQLPRHELARLVKERTSNAAVRMQAQKMLKLAPGGPGGPARR